MQPLKIVFLGTGAFALPAFHTLLKTERRVLALVTQPDRAGRGHHRHPHPLKEAALAAGVETLQPENVNSAASLESLRRLGADLYVVAAYGQILSAELLSIPRFGALNLHGSLLPKYRGAAPVQYALWRGETETGVTVFQIEPKLDAGRILGRVATPIGLKETSGQLHDRLAELAAPLLLAVLDEVERGTARPEPQDAALATTAPRLKKEQGAIDWRRGSVEIGWHLRAMQPWPMPFTFLHRPGRPPQRMLILDADPATEIPPGALQAALPGEILPHPEGLLCVRTGDGAVIVNRLQPAGKREMSASEFLRGADLNRARFDSVAAPGPASSN